MRRNQEYLARRLAEILWTPKVGDKVFFRRLFQLRRSRIESIGEDRVYLKLEGEPLDFFSGSVRYIPSCLDYERIISAIAVELKASVLKLPSGLMRVVYKGARGGPIMLTGRSLRILNRLLDLRMTDMRINQAVNQLVFQVRGNLTHAIRLDEPAAEQKEINPEG